MTDHDDFLADPADPVAARFQARLGELLDGTPKARPDAHASLSALQARLTGESTPAPATRSRQWAMSRSLWRAGMGWRGMVLLAAMAGVAIIVILGRRDSRIDATWFGAPTHHYATVAGQQAMISLPDGSRVTLAPQSQLDVVAPLGGQTRTVTLRGEAYFDVSSATGSIFTVRTGTVTTRVLGTAFDVRHYATDTMVRVAVMSGKVTAAGARANITLTRGLVAHVNDSTASVVSDDAQSATSWTRGELVFKDTPIPEMLATVGQWYGYTFHLADSTLATGRVSAVFHIAESSKTFAAIAHLLNASMTFDGRTVTVRTRAARASAPMRREMSGFFSTSTEGGTGK